MRIPAVVLIVGAMAWPLQPVDDAVRAWMRSHQEPTVRAGMQAVSKHSRSALIGATVLGLLAGPAGRLCVLEGAAGLLPVNLAVEGLKWTVNRTRPDGDTNRRNSSFPSSHAANAFTAAFVLSRRFRRAGPALIVPVWLGAATVAFSRMYLDRHWLSDCIGAALLAWGAGWLAARFISRFDRRKDPVPSA